MINPKPLRIRFFKIDGIIKTWIELGTRCDGTRYLTLFGSEKYEVIDNRIRYLKSQINGITYIFSCYFAKIKVDSYDSKIYTKKLNLHNVIIHIKSILNKDKNHYDYKTFLKKSFYQLAKKWSQIFVHSIIMMRFEDREIAKEKVLCFKKAYNSSGC